MRTVDHRSMWGHAACAGIFAACVLAAAPAARASISDAFLDSAAAGATALNLCVYADEEWRADRWTIRLRAGTSAPSMRARPIATARGDCHVVAGLRTDRPYTFLVVARMHSEFSGARERVRLTLTAAARATGGFVKSGKGAPLKLRGSTEFASVQVATARSRTRLYAAHQRVSKRGRAPLSVTARTATGRWARPVRIATSGAIGLDYLLRTNDRGDVAVAWNDIVDGYTSAYRHLAGAIRTLDDPLEGFAVDAAGRVHLLLRR